MSQQLVIFTDLDGTLLELETYSHQPAEEALSRVLARGIPLIFCSSKTRAEQEEHQTRMGFRGPMIVENGAAIFIPAGYFSPAKPTRDELMEFGVPAIVIRAELRRIRAKRSLDFRGYAELSLDEVCAWTGLDLEAAARAQRREYSETLVGRLSGEEVIALNESLRSAGLAATRGSRFYTVTSARSDKGRAVALLAGLFRQQFGSVMTVGLGDGVNDLPLLTNVDRGFLFQREPSDWEVLPAPGIEVIHGSGPVAWNGVVNRLLDQFPE